MIFVSDLLQLVSSSLGPSILLLMALFHSFRLASSRAQTQQLWLMGLVAPQHVESFLDQRKNLCHVPCNGRRILICQANREVLVIYLQKQQCVYTCPKLPIYPSFTPFPLGSCKFSESVYLFLFVNKSICVIFFFLGIAYK